ncbi:GNAT family N-acetyltransferase [Flavobacterium agricola]|uniref:GNAT family N-acetyltransferase n=1 Tax=Flavobacterium agricola TaxID=2870839 RepID=UPI0029393ECC|nr:GNAT family N-acetyltransferase [Flavobacterium agricola]
MLKATGKKIGSCGLYDRDGVEGVDIGFAFLPEFEGQGFGYESAAKLMQVAQSELGIETISGITAVDNFASQGLLTKLGLKRIGLITLPNDTEEVLLYRNK